MNNIEIIRAFYNTYNYSKVKKAYQATLKYTTVYKQPDKDVLVKYDNDKIELYINDTINLSHDLLNVFGYYFPLYDYEKDCLFINTKGNITLFFYEMPPMLAKFGISIKYDFTILDKKLILFKLLKEEEIDNKILFEYLLEAFDDLSTISFRELKENAYKYIENENENKRIEEITSMELLLDWSNAFIDVEIDKDEYTETSSDGLLKSLHNLGKVDIEYISKLTSKSCKDIIMELRGAIYQNPEKWEECFYKGWETSDEYLSGNIMHKLKVAKSANEKYQGYFSLNVDALEAIMPKELSCEDIYITLGSPWIPSSVIDEFIKYISGRKKPWWYDIHYDTIHDEYTSTWEIPGKSRYYKNVKIDSTYGTSRINALHILERTLNMKTITIYDEVYVNDGKKKKIKVVNQHETLLALEKQQLLIETFKKWVWQDEDRKNMLLKIFENKYCYNIVRKFDGSFLTFKGLSEDIKLYDYQKDAVARIIMTPNTLLAHDVGAGKTFIMCCAGMEMKRTGLSKKNLYVVPNNVVSQWHKIFLSLYPNANLLVVNPNTFKKEKRTEILTKIKENDYDGIIMAYSSFDLIPISKSYIKETIEEEIVKLSKILKNKNKATKQLKAKKDRLVKELEKYNNPKLSSEDIYFDELGINTLFLDEAHNYKNVPIETKINHVLGLSLTGSKKCEEMMHKVHYVQKSNNGRGVVFATGTPITNSLTDIYVMQKYLQSGELNLFDLSSFDSWIGMFAEKEAEFEIDVDTSNYRLATRFRKYHNMPELSSLLANVSDFHHIDKINEIPEFDGYTDTLIKKSKALQKYLKTISERAEKVRKHKVKRKEDNMLKITTDGRKAALDIRLVDLDQDRIIESKVCKCIENVMDIYIKTKAERSTQIIFCDTSTPKNGFNLYDDIKLILLSLNVPSSEIAFIHDATNEKERLKILEDMNKGNIRILLGSTFKLGTGVNVQDKLIAIHHLDVPWRPSDMTQREGRILRKGNENERVQIFRYITDGSFDAYSWQLLESKQKMINSVLAGNMSERMCQEVDDLVLSYSEVKALAVGNPILKRRVEIVNELSKYNILQGRLIKNKHLLELELLKLPSKVKLLEDELLCIKEDKEYFDKVKTKYSQEERKTFKEEIFKHIIDCDLIKEEKLICNYQGFDILMPTNMLRNKPYVYIKHKNKYKLDLGMTDTGIMIRLDNFFDDFDKYIENVYTEILKTESRMEDIKSELSKDSSYIDNIVLLKEELKEIDKKLGVNK